MRGRYLQAHIAVNSDREINISHDQRRDILQFMNSRKFSLLTEAERASIFVEAQREVSRMLELNVLPSLHGSKAFAEVCRCMLSFSLLFGFCVYFGVFYRRQFLS